MTKDKAAEKVKACWVNQFLRGELFIAADYFCTKRMFEQRKDIEDGATFLLNYIRESGKLLHFSIEALR